MHNDRNISVLSLNMSEQVLTLNISYHLVTVDGKYTL